MKSELLTVIAKQIHNQPEVRTIIVPPLKPRSNSEYSLIKEVTENYGLIKRGNVLGGITLAASPHLPRESWIKNNSHKVIAEENIPPHFIIWLLKEGENKNTDIFSIALEEEKERNPYWKVFEQALNQAYNTLSEMDDFDDIAITGLVGNTPSEERNFTGQSRGAQSVNTFHTHVIGIDHKSLSKAKENSTKATPNNSLKVRGLFDSILFPYLHELIKPDIEQLLEVKNIKGKVEKREKVFSERTKITFDEPIEIEDGMNILTDILKKAYDTYSLILLNYGYYKSFEKNDQRKLDTFNIIEGLIKDKYSGTSEETINKLMGLIFQFEQTSSFYYSLLTSPHVPIIQSSKARMDGTYSKMMSRVAKIMRLYLEDNEKDKKLKEKYIKIISRVYSVNNDEAEMLLILMLSTAGGVFSKHTFAQSFSASYKLNVETINGKLMLKSMTIAPKFSGEKGAAEDLLEASLEREEANP